MVWSRSPLRLLSLADVSQISLDQGDLRGSVLVVFQKNCRACHKQVKDLKCIGSKTPIRLVGAFSTEGELRSEYKSFSTSIPGYYGDKDLLQFLQVSEPLTPQVYFFGKNKTYKWKGYTPCNTIHSTLLKDKNDGKPS